MLTPKGGVGGVFALVGQLQQTGASPAKDGARASEASASKLIAWATYPQDIHSLSTDLYTWTYPQVVHKVIHEILSIH